MAVEGIVANQVAGQLGTKAAQDALLQGLNTSMLDEFGNVVMQNGVIPSIAESTVTEAGLTDAMLKMGTEGGVNSIAPATDAIFDQGGQSWFGNAMDSAESFMGNEAVNNTFDIGMKGWGAYDTYQARKNTQKFQDANLKMAQGTYDRNVAADEKRQAINF